jgi:hypothetical protein
MVAGDDACFFKAVDALGHGRGGKANLAADLGKGLAGIVLQSFQDAPGERIELNGIGNGPVRHTPAILKEQVYYA